MNNEGKNNKVRVFPARRIFVLFFVFSLIVITAIHALEAFVHDDSYGLRLFVPDLVSAILVSLCFFIVLYLTRKPLVTELQLSTEALEASMEPAAFLDDRGEFTALNSAFVKALGFESDLELIGKSWRVLYDEHEQRRVESEIMPAAQKEGVWQGSAEARKRDGSIVPQEVLLKKTRGHGFMFFFRDIGEIFSERQQSSSYLMLFHSLIELTGDGVLVISNGDVLLVNRAFCSVSGYAQETVCQKGFLKRNLVVRNDEENESLHSALTAQSGELSILSDSGEVVTYYKTSRAVDYEGRKARLYVLSRRKVRQSAQNAITADAENILEMFLGSIRDPFMIVDKNYRVTSVNESYALMKGKKHKEIIGAKCYDALVGRHDPCPNCIISVTLMTGDPCAKDKPVVYPGGMDGWVEIYTYPVFDEDGGVTHVIEYSRDITDRKRSEDERRQFIKKLEYLSSTDSLTGLLNRRALVERLKAEFERARRYSRPFSLILCDLDFFKEVNDTYGHSAGDRVLNEISKAIVSSLRATDIGGRYGGDEFMVILPDTDIEGAELLAERIRQNVEELLLPVTPEVKLRLSLSLGVTSYDEVMKDYNTIIKCADSALYKSKEQGRNRTFIM